MRVVVSDLLKARAALLAVSPSNIASLEAIESAMIVVCLDDTAPITREDASWSCWVGDGRNRFYDKHQCMFSTRHDVHVNLFVPASDRFREWQVRLPR